MNPVHPLRVKRADRMPADSPVVDLAIVGAGACGLVAAVFAREAGLEVAVLERDALPQGSTALSSGFVPAAGTAVQRTAGVRDDDPARFASDIQAKAKGRAARHLVEAYTQAIAPALDALGERHGLAFELLDGFLYPGHTARRMHALPERTGAALVAALSRAAEDIGAMLVTRARVVELWCAPDDAARVVGVAYERPDGTLEHLGCRALLLACNGFGGNATMVRELLPEMRDAVFAGHTGNDGSAITWARDLGLALADLGGYQGHGSWAVPQGALVTWALMMQGGVQINALGQRFHDETRGYSEAAVEVLAQPGGTAFNVIDSRLRDLGRQFPDFVAAEAAGAVREAADAATLAQVIGCDADELARTLAGTPLRPPFFAIRVTGALFHTQGGIDIDARARARFADGRVHPNLLAAGGAARGVSGDAVWGYLSGNGLLSAVAGGWIAAHTAAELLR
jgi:fumarate reductase flavoprotein subunit